MKRKEIVLIVIGLLLIPTAISGMTVQGKVEPFLSLALKTNGGGVRPDYGLYIAEDLREIGIEVEVKVEEWCLFLGSVLSTNDYDLYIIGMQKLTVSMNTFTEELLFENAIDYMEDEIRKIPYGNESLELLNEGLNSSDILEKQQLIYSWQNMLMDKIVPVLPLFSSQYFATSWANLEGYDYGRDLPLSLPYMEFNGLHDNQEDKSALNIVESWWVDLLHLKEYDGSKYSRNLVLSLLSDELLYYDSYADKIGGLVSNWTRIDDNHFQFFIHDNIYWNPSYNVTLRDSNSDALETIPDSQLMKGLKSGAFSDGTNQKLTAKDVVFTFLAMDNIYSHGDPWEYNWVSDCYVDPADDLSFHLHIDKYIFTPELETFNGFWDRLDFTILPEFFLNSSDSTVSYTEGGVKCIGLYSGIPATSQWISYSKSAFGYGKYLLDYYEEYEFTQLSANPNWSGNVYTDDELQDLEIEKINIFTTEESEYSLFMNGEIDLMGVGQDDFLRGFFEGDERFNVYYSPRYAMDYLGFNLEKPAIGGADNYNFVTTPNKEEYSKSCAFRKAICYAINRNKINHMIHDDSYLISHSVVFPSEKFLNNPSIIKYEYNIESAFEWLVDAGFTNFANDKTIFTPIWILTLSILSVYLSKRLRNKKK